MKNENSTFNALVSPVIVLAVICLVVSALLAVTNSITAPIIEANDIKATNEAYLMVLPGATADGLSDVDVSGFAGVASAVKTEDGRMAIKSNAVGFDGGVIVTILGFDADGNICGIKSDCSSQTAGMGSKCDGEGFTSQFVGKEGSTELTLNVDVDQVGGCTVSSAAFVKAVNNAINCYSEVKGA